MIPSLLTVRNRTAFSEHTEAPKLGFLPPITMKFGCFFASKGLKRYFFFKLFITFLQGSLYLIRTATFCLMNKKPGSSDCLRVTGSWCSRVTLQPRFPSRDSTTRLGSSCPQRSSCTRFCFGCAEGKEVSLICRPRAPRLDTVQSHFRAALETFPTDAYSQDCFRSSVYHFISHH